jgi:hypothetical protein
MWSTRTSSVRSWVVSLSSSARITARSGPVVGAEAGIAARRNAGIPVPHADDFGPANPRQVKGDLHIPQDLIILTDLMADALRQPERVEATPGVTVHGVRRMDSNEATSGLRAHLDMRQLGGARQPGQRGLGLFRFKPGR